MIFVANMLPVLAAKDDAIVAAVVFVITVISWIVKLAGSRSQKAPPVAPRPRPPVRSRDERLQQEINIFLEENPGRRGTAARPTGAARPVAQPPNAGQAKRKSQGESAGGSKKKVRPGAEIAARQAPVSESLGTGVKQHLSQHMTERVAQEMQQRLAPRVEEKAAADLGATVTSGAARPAAPSAVRPATAPRAERFAELLRSPAGVQQAIVLNLILSPPPGRTGSHRR